MSQEFALTSDRPAASRADAILIGIHEGRRLTAAAAELDQATAGRLGKLVDSEDISGKAGRVSVLHGLEGVSSPRVFVVGLGKQDKFDGQAYAAALSKGLRAVRESPAESVLVTLVELEVPGRDRHWMLAQAVRAAGNELYQYTATRKGRKQALKRIELPGSNDTDAQVLERAQALNAGIVFAKELANRPPNICTPAYMAEQAQALIDTVPGVSEILDEHAMEKLGMGSLLAVARGSASRPRLIVLHWRGGPADQAPHVLVGKGITFDTGGISLKPGPGMEK